MHKTGFGFLQDKNIRSLKAKKIDTLDRTFIILGIIISATMGMQSYGLGPANPACWEIGTCDLFGNPLNAMLQPWVDDLGPLAYVLLWGIILGILWLRTHHTLLVGFVGILIASLFTIQGLNTINPQILIVGLSLLAIAACVTIYQLVFVRLIYPS
jgi:hypothetical protein